MNYIAEINAFEQWLETHTLPITAQLLWYKLMAFNNKTLWSEWMQVDNLRLMAALQMGREATLIKARGDLIKAGLIEYQKGKKGSPNRYHMISLTDGNTFRSVVQTVGQTEVQSVAINKYKQKQNINETPPIPPLRCFQKFLASYPGRASTYMTGTAYADLVSSGQVSEDDLVAAAENYADECRQRNTDLRFVKKAENFLRDMTFDYYLPGKYTADHGDKAKEEGYYGISAAEL
nr:MAG TPA: Replication initiator A family protein [Caudoviricetes sp.]